ncbi:hypothetical protein [Peribacillus sp. SCS-37]|uniref:hypothetical protein n=1 Tax=Paraperibacillus esterisolvens TaxID=3115296 RepID=UPI0039061860
MTLKSVFFQKINSLYILAIVLAYLLLPAETALYAMVVIPLVFAVIEGYLLYKRRKQKR